MFNQIKHSLKKMLKRFLRKHSAIKRFPKTKTVSISPDFSTGRYINIQIEGPDIKLEIQQKVQFREFCNILIHEKAELVIQQNVFFNNYCSINCLEKIVIGENTLFGEGVKLYDHNHLYEVSPEILIHPRKFKTAPIIIGRNCWIGSNVTILKGVTMGNNVIIGANNLIYKSIPANTIVKAKADIIMTSH
jgi:acetyltransferase-like isoleucine patch superfamily enzyme